MRQDGAAVAVRSARDTNTECTRSLSFSGPVSSLPMASSPPASQSGSSSKSSQPEAAKVPHDFLSCEDISAQSQKVTCCFLKDVLGIGFIDPSSEAQNVSANTKLELPLWLAKVLYARKLIDVEIPKGYNETYREILDADAAVVDLHKLGPDYYTFGQHLLALGVKDSDAIAKSLVTTFHQRFHHILDYAMNSTLDTQMEMLKFQAQLDNSELDLLSSGRKATDHFKQWENRTCDKMLANEMVSTLNKKKRAVLENHNKQPD